MCGQTLETSSKTTLYSLDIASLNLQASFLAPTPLIGTLGCLPSFFCSSCHLVSSSPVLFGPLCCVSWLPMATSLPLLVIPRVSNLHV